MQVEECADVSILHITSVSHLDAGEVKCRVYLPGQEQARVPDKFITCSAELKVVPAAIYSNSQNMLQNVCDCLNNNGGKSTDREEVMCDLHRPARIVRGPQDVTALVGDRVLLKATYVGQPEPTVLWTRAVSEHSIFLIIKYFFMYAS